MGLLRLLLLPLRWLALLHRPPSGWPLPLVRDWRLPGRLWLRLL